MENFTLEERLKIASIRHILFKILDINLTNMSEKDAYDFLDKIQKQLIDIVKS